MTVARVDVRVCIEKGCSTELSRYNPEDRCAVCARKRRFSGPIRVNEFLDPIRREHCPDCITKHFAKGKCKRCYYRALYAKNHAYRERLLERKRQRNARRKATA